MKRLGNILADTPAVDAAKRAAAEQVAVDDAVDAWLAGADDKPARRSKWAVAK